MTASDLFVFLKCQGIFLLCFIMRVIWLLNITKLLSKWIHCLYGFKSPLWTWNCKYRDRLKIIRTSSSECLMTCRTMTYTWPAFRWSREKEEIWLSPMTEALTPTEKSKKQRDNTKNATKNFDYTTIADRLRTVSWGNNSHPAGVVKPVYGIPTFPLTAKAV